MDNHETGLRGRGRGLEGFPGPVNTNLELVRRPTKIVGVELEACVQATGMRTPRLTVAGK